MQVGSSMPPPLPPSALPMSHTPPPVSLGVHPVHVTMFPPLQKRYAIGKNPSTAVILSILFVGLGQYYNGDRVKAILMLVIALLVGLFTLGIGAIAVWIWCWFDAYLVASGKAPLWY
jgi:hypothetical protein